MENALLKSNPKNTTQSAALEGLLTRWRTAKVRPYVKGKHILDFGCGEHLWTMRSLSDDAASVSGYDILYQNLPKQRTSEGFSVYGTLSQIDNTIDCVISLACFEHIERDMLPSVLRQIGSITLDSAVIVGTVPRPLAKPVLELLSYRLGLIDETQIRDHKIYYDQKTLPLISMMF